MVDEDLAVYLRLTPEFGGTRFGPYEGLEVRLGSDGDRCHIVLSESLGVLSEHVRVTRQGANNIILAPADRSAAIFLWKQGARRPSQLTTLTAIQAGDSFSLVTETGPRFILELDIVPDDVREKIGYPAGGKGKRRKGTGRDRLSAESMGAEVKRQAWTTLLVTGPAQIMQRAVVFVKSGAIYQPRNIIMGTMIAGGWLFGGVSMCKGRSTRAALATTEVKYKSCETSLDDAESLAAQTPEEYAFHQLAGKLTKMPRLSYALEDDPLLAGLVESESRLLLTADKQYAWLLSGKDKQSRRFTSWRERVDESDLDEETKLLVTWLAAMPSRKRGEFGRYEDIDGSTVCGRGPTRLTYRQGFSFGLEVQPDALHEGPTSRLEKDDDLMKTLLTNTLDVFQLEYPDNAETNYASLESGLQCVYLEGDDDRTKDNRVMSAIEKQLGENGKYLPDSGRRYQATARIAKYWSGHFVDFSNKQAVAESNLDFADNVPGNVLQLQESRGTWALKNSARTIAQALAIPCMGVLSGKTERVKTIMGENYKMPSPISCLIFQWKLSKG